MDFQDFQCHISAHHLPNMIATLTRARLKDDWFFSAANLKGVVDFDGARVSELGVSNRFLLHLQCTRH